MRLINTMLCRCPSCMEEHQVACVVTEETGLFKGEPVQFSANYHYCANSGEFFEDEDQMAANDLSMKNAYRKKSGLLTSGDIEAIRDKYGISQTDLALILGWGEKTITRYEGHQVQDAAHDSILRKIEQDPQWYIELLNAYQKKHALQRYRKYYDMAGRLFEKQQDAYLRKSIMGAYAEFSMPDARSGYTELDLNKTVDTIRYFSNSAEVRALYKVKLLKMLWYTDALYFKNFGKTVTGLVYSALSMGAVPIAHNLIVDLDGIRREEVDFGEGTGYHFLPDGSAVYPYLNDSEIEVLNQIIGKFGNFEKKEIVNYMHRETAYMKTQPGEIISFELAKEIRPF